MQRHNLPPEPIIRHITPKRHELASSTMTRMAAPSPLNINTHTPRTHPSNTISVTESGPSPSISAIIASHKRVTADTDAPLLQHGLVARIDHLPARVDRLGAHVGDITRGWWWW